MHDESVIIVNYVRRDEGVRREWREIRGVGIGLHGMVYIYRERWVDMQVGYISVWADKRAVLGL